MNEEEGATREHLADPDEERYGAPPIPTNDHAVPWHPVLARFGHTAMVATVDDWWRVWRRRDRRRRRRVEPLRRDLPRLR